MNSNKSNQSNYIKADNNKIINEAQIRWVKQMDDCLYVCTKSDGCYINYVKPTRTNTLTICKLNSLKNSYTYLREKFE